MKAAVCRGFAEPLSIEEVTLNPPTSGEVHVQLKACAICHSDIYYLDGHWGGELPAVFGHEAAGVVVSVGDGVSNCQTGDHVVVTLIRACGSCHYCSRGQTPLCETEFPLDAQSPLTDDQGSALIQGLRTGAFAEEVVVDASQLCVIDSSIPMDAASLLACGVITGYGAVTQTVAVEPGRNIAVIGCGGVGLNSVQAAAHTRASTVIAIDLEPEKLAAAELFGATHGLNGGSDTLVQEVQALTGGRGVDYVFVTVGARSAIEQSIGLLARGGTSVIVGMPAAGVMAEYDPGSLAGYGQRIVGSKMGSARVDRDIPALANLYLEGTLKLDELISGRYPLEDINAAIDSVKSGKALRNVVIFQ